MVCGPIFPLCCTILLLDVPPFFVEIAHKIFWLTVVGALAGNYFGVIRLSWVSDNFEGLALFSILFSVLLAIYIYVSSFITKELLSDLGNSGKISSLYACDAFSGS